MGDIVLISSKESTRIFLSVGIETIINDDISTTRNEIKKIISLGAKIIIIDEDLTEEIKDIKEHYDNVMYPIFLSLPFGKSKNNSLLELKESIEKAIGFSIN